MNYLLVFLIQLTSINRYPLSLTEKLIFFDFRCLLLLHFDTLFSFQGANLVSLMKDRGGLGRTRTSDLTLIRRAL